MVRRKPVAKRYYRSRRNRLFIPYPAILFMLLCAGVILALWTFRAVADDIHVTAKVPANPVTGPAVITNPVNGQHFSSIPITISGTCPSDGSGGYVKIYRNDVFSGVSICDNSNNFSISSDLFPGANTITAQIYNITDDPGPPSTPVTTYYDVPQPLTPPNTTTPSTKIPALTISSDFKYIGYYVGQTTQWKLNIDGGLSPYAVNVDWGDGKSSVISRKDAGVFSVTHVYKAPGKLKNRSYNINISASDLQGNQASLQLFVIVNDRSVGPVAASIAGSTCSTSGISYSSLTCFIQTRNLLKFLWPAYAIVLLMVISYRLGEREEILIFTKKGVVRKRRT